MLCAVAYFAYITKYIMYMPPVGSTPILLKPVTSRYQNPYLVIGTSLIPWFARYPQLVIVFNNDNSIGKNLISF